MTQVTVQPLYGFGWSDGQRTIEVPAPFAIEIVRGKKTSNVYDEAIGRIVESGHVFENCWALVGLRTSGGSGASYNVYLYKQKPPFAESGLIDPNASMPIATGFAAMT